MTRRLVALVLGVAAALAIAEIAGRVLLGRGALARDASPEAYFAALGVNDADKPLPPRDAPKTSAFRIVVLGDSTAVGFPYGEPLSFGSLLAAALTEATGRACETIQFGVIGRSSAGVAADIDAALALHPDLLLLYVGHNELAHRLSQRSPFGRARAGGLARVLPGLCGVVDEVRDVSSEKRASDLAGMPPAFGVVLEKAWRMRAFGDRESRPPANVPLDPREIDLHRDRFRANVARIVEAAARAHVPILVLEPTSSLLAAPLASGRRFDARAQEAWEEGTRLLETDPKAARAKLALARDLDPAPIRITSPFLKALREGAGAAPCVSLETESGAIEDRFIDWVHPRPELAASMAETIARAIPPSLPSLASADHAALDRFRESCERTIRANAPLAEEHELDGALLSAQMRLHYGARAAAESDLRAVPPEKRTFALTLLLDLALRWHGATAEADVELNSALERHPDWREALAWWRR